MSRIKSSSTALDRERPGSFHYATREENSFEENEANRRRSAATLAGLQAPPSYSMQDDRIES